MGLIIAWLITIGGFATLLWGGIAFLKHQGRVEQEAIDKPKIAAEKNRADVAEAANASLQKDLGTLKAACAVSERAVDSFRRQQAAGIAATKSMLATIEEQERARSRERLDRLQGTLSNSPTGSDCANTETDRILRDGARERMRGATSAKK